MKEMMVFFTLLLTSNLALAAMTQDEQDQYIEQAAKNIRRQYWQQGYKDVSSSTQKMTKSELDEYVKSENNRDYERPLDQEDISGLYRCFHASFCSLYLIYTSAYYYGGYGTTSHFVLLNTDRKNHGEIVHTTYAE